MTEVNPFTIKQVELKYQIRDLSRGKIIRYKSPKDLISLVYSEDEKKTCWTCPRFDRNFDYCKNHLEFILDPENVVCDEYDEKIAYYGERDDLNKAIEEKESFDVYLRVRMGFTCEEIISLQKIRKQVNPDLKWNEFIKKIIDQYIENY